MSPRAPLQGEVWLCDLDPTRGHEQAKRRPCVVVSADEMNRAPIELSLVVPVTGTDHEQPLHVAIAPPEGGLRKRSFALPEQIRSVSHARLARRLGCVRPATTARINSRVGALLRVSR